MKDFWIVKFTHAVTVGFCIGNGRKIDNVIKRFQKIHNKDEFKSSRLYVKSKVNVSEDVFLSTKTTLSRFE